VPLQAEHRSALRRESEILAKKARICGIAMQSLCFWDSPAFLGGFKPHKPCLLLAAASLSDDCRALSAVEQHDLIH
jgi:hypothetical protein